MPQKKSKKSNLIIKTDGSFFKEERAGFDPLYYKETTTNPITSPARIGAAAMVYYKDNLIAQKIYSRLGQSPIEAEALAISLGLSAVNDLIYFNSIDNWKISLDRAVDHYFDHADFFISRPRLLAIYPKRKRPDQSTLKEGVVSVFDVKKRLIDLGFLEDEIAIDDNQPIKLTTSTKFIISARPGKTMDQFSKHIFHQLYLDKIALTNISNEFLILNDNQSLVNKIKSNSLGKGFPSNHQINKLLLGPNREKALSKYLNSNQLSWRPSGKDSLEHNWAKFAAQTNSIDRQLKFTNEDLSRKKIQLYQEANKLTKDLNQLEEEIINFNY